MGLSVTTMSETLSVGSVPLPDGIEVDETAAYFGIFSSSDVITGFSELPEEESIIHFISSTGDLLLSDDPDLFSIAERLGCEGGEVYYLMNSALGLVSISDPLRLYLGLDDSAGNPGGVAPSDIDSEQLAELTKFTDHNYLLRALTIAYANGSDEGLRNYYGELSALLSDPAVYRGNLLVFAKNIEDAGEVSVIPSPLSLPPPGTFSKPEKENSISLDIEQPVEHSHHAMADVVEHQGIASAQTVPPAAMAHMMGMMPPGLDPQSFAAEMMAKSGLSWPIGMVPGQFPQPPLQQNLAPLISEQIEPLSSGNEMIENAFSPSPLVESSPFEESTPSDVQVGITQDVSGPLIMCVACGAFTPESQPNCTSCQVSLQIIPHDKPPLVAYPDDSSSPSALESVADAHPSPISAAVGQIDVAETVDHEPTTVPIKRNENLPSPPLGGGLLQPVRAPIADPSTGSVPQIPQTGPMIGHSHPPSSLEGPKIGGIAEILAGGRGAVNGSKCKMCLVGWSHNWTYCAVCGFGPGP